MFDYSESQLQAAAQRVATVYAEICNKEFGCKLPIPMSVDFDLCKEDPKCAGRAHGDHHISLNMILFEDNISEMLNQVIPHEIAHLVQVNRLDRRGLVTQDHGVEWQEIMRRLGKDPEKYHSMNLERAIEWNKQWKKEQKAEQKAAAKRREQESED